MNLHESEGLQQVINKCRQKDRRAQQELFNLTYSYALSICLRFTTNRAEAKEVLNDGFLKVFNHLDKYSPQLSFAGWVRKIMVNAAIDHYRKNKRYFEKHLDMSHIKEEPEVDDLLATMSSTELLRLVQELPPAYRMVFSLFAVEGFTHREIADRLGITEGTSKSNYAKARLKLKKSLESMNKPFDQTYG